MTGHRADATGVHRADATGVHRAAATGTRSVLRSGLRRAAMIVAVAVVIAACSSSGESVTPSTDGVATEGVVASTTPTGEIADVVEEISGASGVTVLPPVDEESAVPERVRTAAETAQALGRGINFGNALEAPREGDWGVSLEEGDFARIAEAGFDHVRVPVSWAGYASETAPFTIPDGVDPTVTHPDYDNIWERVDWVIEQAEANNLMVILNMHHYDEAHVDPEAHTDRIVGMWEQISARYTSASNSVVFELFNEPHGEFTERPELWNDLASDLVDTVRVDNPNRTILAGPVGFNHISELETLELPDDPNLVATVHLYEPFDFTHQGADWVEDVPPLGATWSVDQVALADGFRDLSWDTTSVGEGGALRVDYSRQWAGFSIGWTNPLTPAEVRFKASSDEETTIQVGCQEPGNGHIEVERVDLSPQTADFSVDLSSCAENSIGVGILNANTDLIPVRFEGLEVCTADGVCEESISNSDAALRGWLRQANEWSAATGVPVHLGEFGAFDGNGAVPVDDRAAWTETIVDEAIELGIPFSYWEYNSGFGAFDPDVGDWVSELRDALTT